jgi:hypothetical protein
MRAIARFAAAGALSIAICAGVLVLIYHGPAERRAIALSALVAMVVQVVTFAIVRSSATQNVFAAWGLGSIVRFLVLIVYALGVVKTYALPASASAISLALFLFVSTLLEPLFLKT